MTKHELVQNTDLFLLDLDGTVYLDDTPIGGACRTLARLRAAGKKLVFLTNNSSKTEAQYRAKLARIGLLGEGDGVFTSGMATTRVLRERYAGKRVFLLGTAALREEFAAAGVPLFEDDPEVCVLAYDTELTYPKLCAFQRALARGLPYLATHPDAVCPTASGFVPDAGSLIALFSSSAGRTPDLIVGKPHAEMARQLREEYGVPSARTCMIGDRMHTDIRFANGSGMRSVLVLSGETTRENMGKFPDTPDLVLPDINAIF